MPGQVFELTGIATYLAMLRSLQGKQLESVTRKSLSKAAQKIIAPAIASAGATGWRYGGRSGGKYPTKGLLGKRSKVTSRMVRPREGEFVAISTKPRVWFLHMVVRGTKPHVITARNRSTGARASSHDVRALNRANREGGASALAFNGRFVAEVSHPGAASTDYIPAAVAGKEVAVLDELARGLIAQAAAAGHTTVGP